MFRELPYHAGEYVWYMREDNIHADLLLITFCFRTRLVNFFNDLSLKADWYVDGLNYRMANDKVRGEYLQSITGTTTIPIGCLERLTDSELADVRVIEAMESLYQFEQDRQQRRY